MFRKVVSTILAGVVLWLSLILPIQAQSIPFPGPGGVALTISNPTSLGLGTATASGSTQQFTLSGAITGGGTVFVYVFTQQAGPRVVSSMSDGTNSYTKATSNTQAGSVTGELWYVINATAVGGTPTITATMNGAASANSTVMTVSQATGISSIDRTSVGGNSAAGQTTLSSGSTTTLATPIEIVIGAVGVNVLVTITEDATFTNINNSSIALASFRMAYKKVTSTTAVSYVPSIPSTTCTWVSIVATFR